MYMYCVCIFKGKKMFVIILKNWSNVYIMTGILTGLYTYMYVPDAANINIVGCTLAVHMVELNHVINVVQQLYQFNVQS